MALSNNNKMYIGAVTCVNTTDRLPVDRGPGNHAGRIRRVRRVGR